ncbi:long-chain-fatty-acid--CoA ligase FadD [Mycobacteroides abscessus subsp. massiliense]|nr:long-chain-fatty-acid--CoA ligase FadD [Mycobacteroides abscessus subsp. massiliense]
MLEDQLRAHPLISQAMAVGDKQPFIGALITIDPEAIDGWKQRNGKPADATVADLVEDSDLLAEIGTAKFRILPVDFTEATGEMTPTLKVKRNVVAEKFASDIDAIYAGAPQ